jgi:hypothetical protein
MPGYRMLRELAAIPLGKRCRAGVATSTHRYSRCSIFCQSTHQKNVCSAMVSSHGQKLSLHFADRHFEWLPNSERDAPGGKAVSLPRTTTYKAPNGRDH